MSRKMKAIAAASAAVVALGIGAGVAVAGAGDDGNEAPVTGPALDRASAAALTETGGGKVTGSEIGDENAYYEIEVTLDDGSQVDVHLDADFRVVPDPETDDVDDDLYDEGGPNDD